MMNNPSKDIKAEGKKNVAMMDAGNSAPNSTSSEAMLDGRLQSEESHQVPSAHPSFDDDNENTPCKDKSVSSTDDDEDSSGNIRNDEEPDDEDKTSMSARLCKFWWQNDFLILVIIVISLARAYPPLGAEYLAPKITADWMAVCLIFLLAGLGLNTDEFAKAFRMIWFNLYVQGFNFGFVSAVVFVVTRGLQAANILPDDLASGLVVTSCLPMSINMVIVLTKLSDGDESLAIVNAAAGNMIGVFLSPVLILGYIGVEGDIDLVEVFYKLAV